MNIIVTNNNREGWYFHFHYDNDVCDRDNDDDDDDDDDGVQMHSRELSMSWAHSQ